MMTDIKPFKKGSLPPAKKPQEMGYVSIPKTGIKAVPPMLNHEKYIVDNWGKLQISSLAKILWVTPEKIKEITIRLGLLNPVPEKELIPKRGGLSDEQAKKLIELISTGMTSKDIATAISVGYNTVIHYLKIHKDIRSLRPKRGPKPKVIKPPREKVIKPPKFKVSKPPAPKPVPEPKPAGFYDIRKPKLDLNAPISEEEIQKFLKTNTITICPPAGSPEAQAMPPLSYDWATRRMTRRTDIQRAMRVRSSKSKDATLEE